MTINVIQKYNHIEILVNVITSICGELLINCNTLRNSQQLNQRMSVQSLNFDN